MTSTVYADSIVNGSAFSNITSDTFTKFTNGNLQSACLILSDNANTSTFAAVGRQAIDGDLAVVETNNNYLPGSVPGDVTFRCTDATKSVHFTVNNTSVASVTTNKLRLWYGYRDPVISTFIMNIPNDVLTSLIAPGLLPSGGIIALNANVGGLESFYLSVEYGSCYPAGISNITLNVSTKSNNVTINSIQGIPNSGTFAAEVNFSVANVGQYYLHVFPYTNSVKLRNPFVSATTQTVANISINTLF